MRNDAYNVKLQTGIDRRYEMRDKVAARISEMGKVLGKNEQLAKPQKDTKIDTSLSSAAGPAAEKEFLPENMPKVERY